LRKRVDIHTVNTVSFKETIDFSIDTPHSVRIKHFPCDELVPLHYAETIEILVATNVDGRVVIGKQSHTFLPHDVVVIPPYYVHSTICRQCSGELYNFKISLENMKAFVDINAVLQWSQKQIFGRLFIPELYDKMTSAVHRLISEDENIFSRIHCILDVVEMLAEVNEDVQSVSCGSDDEDRLRDLIRWTHEHCREHITLDTAAAQMNMSKYYLCKFFKQHTSMTYVTYLNQVRLEDAAQMLLTGKNVTEAALECGFESVSYFVQLFRRVNGCTPGQFVKLNGIILHQDNIATK